MAEDVVNELEKKIALYETVKKRQPAETGDYASKVSVCQAFKPSAVFFCASAFTQLSPSHILGAAFGLVVAFIAYSKSLFQLTIFPG